MIFQKGLESVFKNRQSWGVLNFGAQLFPNSHSAI